MENYTTVSYFYLRLFSKSWLCVFPKTNTPEESKTVKDVLLLFKIMQGQVDVKLDEH